MTVLHTRKSGLIQKATKLKRAWVVAAAWVGGVAADSDVPVPRYADWARRELDEQVRALSVDLDEVLKRIFGSTLDDTIRARARTFLSDQYDRFFEAQAPFSLCKLQDFELAVGPLPAKKMLDAPP